MFQSVKCLEMIELVTRNFPFLTVQKSNVHASQNKLCKQIKILVKCERLEKRSLKQRVTCVQGRLD